MLFLCSPLLMCPPNSYKILFFFPFRIYFFSECGQHSGHTTLKQRRYVARCIDVDSSLYKRHVPAGKSTSWKFIHLELEWCVNQCAPKSYRLAAVGRWKLQPTMCWAHHLKDRARSIPFFLSVTFCRRIPIHCWINRELCSWCSELVSNF